MHLPGSLSFPLNVFLNSCLQVTTVGSDFVMPLIINQHRESTTTYLQAEDAAALTFKKQKQEEGADIQEEDQEEEDEEEEETDESSEEESEEDESEEESSDEVIHLSSSAPATQLHRLSRSCMDIPRGLA